MRLRVQREHRQHKHQLMESTVGPSGELYSESWRRQGQCKSCALMRRHRLFLEDRFQMPARRGVLAYWRWGILAQILGPETMREAQCRRVGVQGQEHVRSK